MNSSTKGIKIFPGFMIQKNKIALREGLTLRRANSCLTPCVLIAWQVLRSTFWLFKEDFLIHKISHLHAVLRTNVVAASLSAAFICLYPKIQTLKGCCQSPFISQFSHSRHAVSHITI